MQKYTIKNNRGFRTSQYKVYSPLQDLQNAVSYDSEPGK